ncbi:MAG: hypothetical protein H6897_02465 [Rhodobacteraceae bacterium]|jgi:hypothetical protein|uniref:hypothetical protein n=1 Tax=Albidovulum sp. TaxID=1872424 RepID=UPI001E031ABB|nr:hypothetical protein [uncultured Defluviimonas sp.]MCB2124700.1 hypothetical protein [Paracoccaceae bacterium]MCC0068773.1 hypothetical protein [Paracoccaceae bacterium]
MDWLIWTGAGVTLLGLAGLVWCIVKVTAARKAGLSDADLRARLQRVVAMNFAALLVSALGLMMVVMGIALG